MTDWMPDWRGRIAVLVASGPSALEVDLSLARHVAAVGVVNSSFRLAPWADVLYAADAAWWTVHDGAPDFMGLKIAVDGAEQQDGGPRGARRAVALAGTKRVILSGDDMIFDRRGYIGRGGNSGFQLLNLAVQFGARHIALVGYDFCGDHWHGMHPEPLRNHRQSTMDRWAARLDAQAPCLIAHGIEVINCSTKSILGTYPKMSLPAALKRFAAHAAVAA